MQKLKAAGVRVEVDKRNEKVGYKIREGQLQKIPYLLIVGDKEIEQGAVAVRHRKDGDLGSIAFNEFKEKITAEIASRDM